MKKLLAVSAVPLLFMEKSEKVILTVQQQNKEIFRAKIFRNTQKVFKVNLLKGGVAEIEVVNGKVRIKPLPSWLCPQHICSNMGFVKFEENRNIICMPAKLVVSLTQSN